MNAKTVLLPLATLVALGFLLVGRHDGPWLPNQIAGLAILAPSCILWAVARFQLGESFAVQAQARKLVTHGIYSKIRNPIYLFGGLAILGTLVYVGNPYLFLLLAVLVPLQAVRARKEESILSEAFPNQYLEYKRKTWF